MKGELDEGNYQGMIIRLAKGSPEEKSSCLKKFIFLYENARSRIYLYERRITECLQLLLFMEEKDIATLTLNLLQRIIANTTPQSDIFSIIKKKLLSKIVLNLGSVEITTRKISHKCLLEYIRKSKDFDAITNSYIKTGIQQTDNLHLKHKCINSLHSLIMAEPKYFQHGLSNTQTLIEQIILCSYQKQSIEIRRASILCLLEILRLDGSEKTLKMISSTAQQNLYDLKMENTELASLLQLIMKQKNNQKVSPAESQIESVPSPKFMSINDDTEQVSKIQQPVSFEQEISDKIDKINEIQMKVYNDVSFAQDFLKRLQKSQSWELRQIKEFAPYLEKYLVDESIKLFSISKKIVQVIFDNECQEQRDYYNVLVPCVVNGIGNKRFIVRKNLDKLVRQYIKNHTEIWVQNFIERFAQTQNQKIKEILIELFLHAYRTSPEFYHPTNRTFTVMQKQIKDSYSNLKWKAVDCLITVIEKQSKNETQKQEMMSTLSPEVYNKIVRKMNKTQNSIGSNPGSLEPTSPTQRIKRKQRMNIRLTTDEPVISIEKMNEQETRKNNISQEKNIRMAMAYKQRDRKTRKSQADIDFKIRKPRQERESIKKLPELRRGKYSNIVSSRIETNNQSPVKKLMGEKSIMYVDKQNLPQILQPKTELEKALILIKDNSWNTQFQSINCIRAIIQNHRQLISEEIFVAIITELLLCLNNMRSGVSKIALICLGELLRKFHKRAFCFTEQIITTLAKKSITTSDFIQEEIKRCILVSVDELCPTRIISTLNSLKENSKGSEMKVSILWIIDAATKNQKLYKRQIQWIWTTLIDFHEDPSLQVKTESRKIAKTIIESHKDWKNDVNGLRLYLLQRIDKLIKGIIGCLSIGQSNEAQWLQIENKQLSKIISAKVMTSKYFANEFNKFEEQDKNLNLKKNFKQRSRLLNSIFSSAFEYPSEFQSNSNAKKYLNVAIDHLDQKNPGLFINSLSLISKSVDIFPSLIEENLGSIFEKVLGLLDLKKVQMGQSVQKLVLKIYESLNKLKCCKQLLKLSVSSTSSLKLKIETFNQVAAIFRLSQSQQQQTFLSLESQILKAFLKFAAQPTTPQMLKQTKVKDLINICCQQFSNDFRQKMQSNPKLVQISEQIERNEWSTGK